MAQSQPLTFTLSDIPSKPSRHNRNNSNHNGSSRHNRRAMSLSQRLANRQKQKKSDLNVPPAPTTSSHTFILPAPPIESSIDIYEILPDPNCMYNHCLISNPCTY